MNTENIRKKLPELATIEQACERTEKKTNEKWILPRLIECGLRPYFWIDYSPDHPKLFGNKMVGFLSEMIFNGDLNRLEAQPSDALVNYLTNYNGETTRVFGGWRFPLSELRFKREEIEETARLMTNEAKSVTLFEIGIPKRTVYALAHGGIDSLTKLLNSSSDYLLNIPNIGLNSLKCIKNCLAGFNLKINGDL